MCRQTARLAKMFVLTSCSHCKVGEVEVERAKHWRRGLELGGMSVCRHADAMIAELAVPAPDSEPLHFPTEYAVGRLGQLKIIVWKLSCVYWRYTGAPVGAHVPACQARVLRC